MDNKKLFEQELKKYSIFYNRINNQNYILNNRDIEDLSSYTTCKIAQQYLNNFINTRELFGDESLLELFKVDMDILIDNFIEAIYYGFVAYELIYEPSENGSIVLSKMERIPYDLIPRYDENILSDNLKIGSIILPPEKFIWVCLNDPYPFGKTILTCDLSKLILEARKIKTSREYFAYRLANPLYVGQIDSTENANRFLKAIQGLKKGITGLVVGSEDTIELVQENTNPGTLFNEILNNINDEILLAHNITPNLVNTNTVGSYAKAETEKELLYNVLNNYISIINSMLTLLSDRLSLVNGIKYEQPLNLTIFAEKDYDTTFNILNNVIDWSINPKLGEELVNDMLKNNLHFDNILSLNFEKTDFSKTSDLVNKNENVQNEENNIDE